jgi:hypothetical protein
MPSNASAKLFAAYKALAPSGKVSAMDMLKNRLRSALLVVGEAGSGKTFTLFQILAWLIDHNFIRSPEEVLVYFIDFDLGFQPLIEQVYREKMLPTEYLDRIQYRPVADSVDLENATQEAVTELQRMADTLPPERRYGLWTVVDNLQRAWSVYQEDYSMDMYGIPLSERMREAQKEAVARGNKTLPTLSQRDDYKVINHKHDEWLLSGIKYQPWNYLCLSPVSFQGISDSDSDDSKGKVYLPRYGKKDLAQHFDFILAKSFNRRTREWYVEIVKARGKSYYPPAFPQPRFAPTSENIGSLRSPVPEIVWGSLVEENTPKDLKVVPVETKTEDAKVAEPTPAGAGTFSLD